ncbi:hypothetical protein AAG570_002192 [Ranatra chinensis]|uniref:Uncharacterized protein n=1 Tax=Ranatra chinensis TaxID=642074 RepID=A0ABD0YV70_9HEMI
MASKRRNVFYQNKKQETTEIVYVQKCVEWVSRHSLLNVQTKVADTARGRHWNVVERNDLDSSGKSERLELFQHAVHLHSRRMEGRENRRPLTGGHPMERTNLTQYSALIDTRPTDNDGTYFLGALPDLDAKDAANYSACVVDLRDAYGRRELSGLEWDSIWDNIKSDRRKQELIIGFVSASVVIRKGIFAVALGDVESDHNHKIHTIEKRHVGVLARMGELPYRPGKRYVAALARNGELGPFMRPGWNKKMQHSLEDLEERLEDTSQEDSFSKRYIGALAKSGDLRSRDKDEKRDEVDSLLHELITSEELRRLRLEALREELFREREEQAELEEEREEEKRTVASLARSGSLPVSNMEGKRSADYVDQEEDLERRNGFSDEELFDEDSAEKRAGISSLARNGYSFPNNKRHSMDDDLEELMNEVYGIDDKRNVASLARNFNFPTSEKKNIGSFFRSGGTAGRLTKKESGDDEWEDPAEEKRHIGSLFKNNNAPYAEKKNIGSLAKNRDFPHAFRASGTNAKREVTADEDQEEMSKRYVATLLRQGRLPVGLDAPMMDADDEDTALKDDNGAKEDEKDSLSARKKKSVSPTEGVVGPAPPAQVSARSKRETFVPVAAPSGDFLLPLVAQSDVGFAEFDPEQKYSDDYSSPLNKRYYGALARNGWLPAGASRSSYSSAKRHIGALARLGLLRSSAAYTSPRHGRSAPPYSVERCLVSRDGFELFEASAIQKCEQNRGTEFLPLLKWHGKSKLVPGSRGQAVGIRLEYQTWFNIQSISRASDHSRPLRWSVCVSFGGDNLPNHTGKIGGGTEIGSGAEIEQGKLERLDPGTKSKPSVGGDEFSQLESQTGD